jgi:predicted esterase
LNVNSFSDFIKHISYNEQVAQQLAPALPFVKWILPNAPTQPVTLNMGMRMPSWHDIQSLDALEENTFTGLDESVRDIQQLMRAEVAAGMKADRIVLAGFSQGGAVSLMAGLTFPDTLAGVVSMSSYLPFKGAFAEAMSDAAKTSELSSLGERVVLCTVFLSFSFIRCLQRTTTHFFILSIAVHTIITAPVLQCHGTSDEVVAPKAGARAHQQLKDAGVNTEMKTYDGMGHSSCPQELRDLARFLTTVLPATKDGL